MEIILKYSGVAEPLNPLIRATAIPKERTIKTELINSSLAI